MPETYYGYISLFGDFSLNDYFKGDFSLNDYLKGDFSLNDYLKGDSYLIGESSLKFGLRSTLPERVF